MTGQSGRGPLIIGAKVLVSAMLLLLLFWRLPLGAVFAEHQNKILSLLLVSAVLLFLAIGLAAVRWWILLGTTGSPLPFRKVAELTLIGHFFNQFLPTTIGGDTVRIWGGVRLGLPLGQAATTVILDRFVGLTALLAIILAGQPFLAQQLDVPQSTALPVAFVIACGVIACLALPLLDHIFQRFGKNRITAFVSQLSTTARQLLAMPLVTSKTLALSIMNYGILLFLYSFVAQGLGIDLTFLAAFAVIPTVTLIAGLPISIAGWGVREAGLATAFMLMGLPVDLAVITSIVIGLGNLLSALPGGVIWFQRRRLI